MDLTVLAFGLLAAAFLALGYALGAARRRCPFGRGVTLAALRVAGGALGVWAVLFLFYRGVIT